MQSGPRGLRVFGVPGCRIGKRHLTSIPVQEVGLKSAFNSRVQLAYGTCAAVPKDLLRTPCSVLDEKKPVLRVGRRKVRAPCAANQDQDQGQDGVHRDVAYTCAMKGKCGARMQQSEAKPSGA